MADIEQNRALVGAMQAVEAFVSAFENREKRKGDKVAVPYGACRVLLQALSAFHPTVPIPMVLHCPACGMQHIDAPEADAAIKMFTAGIDGQPMPWTNPPHRSHLCHGCGHIWRPADVPTNGVGAITTKGKADSPIASHPTGERAWSKEDVERAARAYSETLFGPQYDLRFPGMRHAEAVAMRVALASRPAPEPEGGVVPQGWQDIESAPRDGQRILAAGGSLDQVEIVSYFPRIGAWKAANEPDGYDRPTLWRPLPGPKPPTFSERINHHG